MSFITTLVLSLPHFNFICLLRRLKEQEKLLVNCIETSEINQTSMCETIYVEIGQVFFFF
jgi:hypothetical protein